MAMPDDTDTGRQESGGDDEDSLNCRERAENKGKEKREKGKRKREKGEGKGKRPW